MLSSAPFDGGCGGLSAVRAAAAAAGEGHSGRVRRREVPAAGPAHLPQPAELRQPAGAAAPIHPALGPLLQAAPGLVSNDSAALCSGRSVGRFSVTLFGETWSNLRKRRSDASAGDTFLYAVLVAIDRLVIILL